MDSSIVWDRVAEQGFPSAEELKQRVRGANAPFKHAGQNNKAQRDDELDDDEAAGMKAFYGVM